jgi:hypothetical protein
MGWSCRADAAKTYDKWDRHCRETTGSSNVFVQDGEKFFFEGSRKEHADGAITGSIFKMIGKTHARKVGSFRINGDGTVARAPKVLKDLSKSS